MILWAILKASRGLQAVVLILGLLGAWEANNAWQRSVGRSDGVSTVTTIAKQKADTNAELGESAREAVAARKPGKPDPSRLDRMRQGTARGPGYRH